MSTNSKQHTVTRSHPANAEQRVSVATSGAVRTAEGR